MSVSLTLSELQRAVTGRAALSLEKLGRGPMSRDEVLEGGAS